jgi:hypothetical protein
MGLGVALAAPTNTTMDAAWTLPACCNTIETLFASFSSQSPVNRPSSHAGGWGLLAAAFATLLAITGSLGFERQQRSWTDRPFFAVPNHGFLDSVWLWRCIAFVASGVPVSGEAFLPIFCTATACMAVYASSVQSVVY